MKITSKQQTILNCLACNWRMLQSYDFPIRLESPTYFANSIPSTEVCPKPTRDKLLELGLIEYTEIDVHKIYRLTDLGKEYARKES